MPKYKITWEARGVGGFKEVEAATRDEAEEIAYDLAREDFDTNLDVTIKEEGE